MGPSGDFKSITASKTERTKVLYSSTRTVRLRAGKCLEHDRRYPALSASLSHATAASNSSLPVNYGDDDVDRSRFFTSLGLSQSRPQVHCVESAPSVAVDCDVVVIDDDDDDDDDSVQQKNDCLSDLFGTTRPLRGDRDSDGSASRRLLQPCSRLRRLLTIDISSPLGCRTLACVKAAMKSDNMPLNPCTVAHSLSGSDNSLDYGMFCRTPVKGIFGRLRQREFPVKFRAAPSRSYCHQYCFSRAERRRFCRRIDTGLDIRSRRLRRVYRRCDVKLELLTSDEITDWQSSERLRDYVARMQQKEAARLQACQLEVQSCEIEVIDVSSESEDEEVSPCKPPAPELVFTCHKCQAKIACGSRFRELVRAHYGDCHAIYNIDIVNAPQPDGTVALQIIHLSPATSMQHRNKYTTSALHNYVTPGTQQNMYTGSCPRMRSMAGDQSAALSFQQPLPEHSSSSDSVVPTAAFPTTVFANNHVVRTAAMSRSSLPLPGVVPRVSLLPLPGGLFDTSRSVLRNQPMLCRTAANASPQALHCDADVICLD